MLMRALANVPCSRTLSLSIDSAQLLIHLMRGEVQYCGASSNKKEMLFGKQYELQIHNEPLSNPLGTHTWQMGGSGRQCV